MDATTVVAETSTAVYGRGPVTSPFPESHQNNDVVATWRIHAARVHACMHGQ
jgi:hypothetical protein